MTSIQDELYEVIVALNNSTTSLDVDAVFENFISKASAETVKLVAEKMDEQQETQFRKEVTEEPLSASECRALLAEAKEDEASTDPDEIASLQEDIVMVQAALQIILNIAKIRGDEASPYTKAVVEEMKKLSTEEYNSLSGLRQARFNVNEKLAPAAPKTNPFAALEMRKSAPKRREP
jgi:hypothetical protein